MKNFDITVEMPAMGNAYGIKITVASYDETDNAWLLQSIVWKTYCGEFNDDIEHRLYEVWFRSSSDLMEMLEDVHRLIEKYS